MATIQDLDAPQVLPAGVRASRILHLKHPSALSFSKSAAGTEMIRTLQSHKSAQTVISKHVRCGQIRPFIVAMGILFKALHSQP